MVKIPTCSEKFKDGHVEKYKTEIFQETPSTDNPYNPIKLNCFGYDQVALVEHLDFAQYLYLLLKGELPDIRQAKLLNRALIAFSNPGPRHPATRAAVSAAVGKTVHGNVLPAALLIMNGKEDGAGAVVDAMSVLEECVSLEPKSCFNKVCSSSIFGLSYGSSNVYLDDLCESLQASENYRYLGWGQNLLTEYRASDQDLGWRFSGLVAAVFCELGIASHLAPGLLQLLTASGLLAQGMEHARRSPTILPFVKDENYEIEAVN